ncbi:hypothetical protein SF123566_2618, partial [Shigella flexneri 1235-66]
MPDGDDYARFGNNTLQCHVFLSLKARTAFAVGLFCRKIVARVSLPIS